LGALPVARWYAAGGARECPALTGRPILALRAGQVVHRCLGWSLRCLQAAEGEVSENDHSPVLALCRGPDVLGLWTGDLEAAGEEALLARRPASARRLQVWKAGHHGSGTSGCPGFLDWARPRLVLISCGTENRHRHPSHGPYVCAGDTMKLLRTDLDGSILLAWDGRGRLSWHTARGRDGRLPPP
jgi:beta-lactamase superfamily II metal-dependent hydrolase